MSSALTTPTSVPPTHDRGAAHMVTRQQLHRLAHGRLGSDGQGVGCHDITQSQNGMSRVDRVLALTRVGRAHSVTAMSDCRNLSGRVDLRPAADVDVTATSTQRPSAKARFVLGVSPTARSNARARRQPSLDEREPRRLRRPERRDAPTTAIVRGARSAVTCSVIRASTPRAPRCRSHGY